MKKRPTDAISITCVVQVYLLSLKVMDRGLPLKIDMIASEEEMQDLVSKVWVIYTLSNYSMGMCCLLTYHLNFLVVRWFAVC